MPTVAEIVMQKWQQKFSPEERARIDATVNRIRSFVQKVQETASHLANAAAQAAERADRSHERGQLLRLYRQRHKWKTADISRLKTYRLNEAASKRVAILSTVRKLGPGATVPFQTWTEQMAAVGQYVVKLSDPGSTGVERLRVLHLHRSWYPQFVELTYRGEYERLKRLGRPASHDAAEQAVADAFLISRESVRRFYVMVRRDFAAGQSRSPSMTVADLELWKQTGQLPDYSNKESV